jgi:hypothetical protein
MGEVVGWRSFFRCYFGKRTAGPTHYTVDPEPSGLTYDTSINAVSAKNCHLGNVSIRFIPWGTTPKSTSFRGRGPDSNGQWGFPAGTFARVSQLRRYRSKRLMTQNMYVGNIHKVRSEKIEEVVSAEVKVTLFRACDGDFMPQHPVDFF